MKSGIIQSGIKNCKSGNVVVVGCGGIATHLLSALALSLQPKQKLKLIDGDKFEKGNLSRQIGEPGENKATFWTKRTAALTQSKVSGETHFLTKHNIKNLICDGDVVLACVDNHATRKLLQDHCKSLKTSILISGGNGLTTGDVRVFVRQNRKNGTKPIYFGQPEMMNPDDRNPADISCSEIVASQPQLVATNCFVAAVMLNEFNNLSGNDVTYLDININNIQGFKL